MHCAVPGKNHPPTVVGAILPTPQLTSWPRHGEAMLRTDEMRERNRHINDLCKGFEPVMYEVVGVV